MPPAWPRHKIQSSPEKNFHLLFPDFYLRFLLLTKYKSARAIAALSVSASGTRPRTVNFPAPTAANSSNSLRKAASAISSFANEIVTSAARGARPRPHVTVPFRHSTHPNNPFEG